MPKNILKPNKLLGQNFLRDKNILRKIIAAANLTANDTVLEVGPGEGTLTEELALAAGRVIAVEKDRNLVAQLKIKFADTKNVEIIEGDILKIDFLKFFSRHPERSEGSIDSSPEFTPHTDAGPQNDNLVSYKVVANIPYYLTSHLIRLLLESDNPPQDIILMIQKEVAQRICAKPPKMSLLSVSVQFYAAPRIIARVPRGAFYPRPKVDSAIIRITPYPKSSPTLPKGREKNSPPLGGVRGDLIPSHPPFTKEGVANFFKVLHAGFSHPRKQLLNNLSAELNLPREDIAKFLQATGLKPTQRAETLEVDDWIKLAEIIQL